MRATLNSRRDGRAGGRPNLEIGDGAALLPRLLGGDIDLLVIPRGSVPAGLWSVPLPAAPFTPFCLVLAVHGRGQTPTFMRDQAQRLAVEGWHFLCLPRGGRAGPDERARRIDHHLAAGFGDDRIVVWGFSQGACLLAHHLLTRPSPVAGAVVFDGGYVGSEPDSKRETSCGMHRTDRPKFWPYGRT
ncbi:MAG TPA: hypothetical protein VIW24_06150 [Aldersonia sp.]